MLINGINGFKNILIIRGDAKMRLDDIKLLELSTEAIEIVEEVLNVDVPRIRFSLYDAKSHFGVAKIRSQEVQISRYVANFHTEEACVNTLIHEILHIVNPREGHTGRWLSHAKTFNRSKFASTYGDITRAYKPSESQEIERQKDVKYEIKCTVCGKIISRKKMSNLVKHPSHYRCKCGGRLERIK